MSQDAPTVDGRSREELVEQLQERAANYTGDWDPYSPDSGQTLLYLFSRFGVDVLKRLNDVPHKHRVAFLTALDFDRRPPQSARVPLTFTTTADIGENVVVPGGTQATAETAEGESVIFEIPEDAGFEATAASLTSVYALDPDDNSIYDQSDVLESAGDERLLAGEDLQAHECYFGHEDILNLDADALVTVSMKSPTRDAIASQILWEYYGEDEEGNVGWHDLPPDIDEGIADPFDDDIDLQEKRARVKDRVRRLEEVSTEELADDEFKETFRLPGAMVTTDVDGVGSRWLRAVVPGDEPADFEIELEMARLDVEGGGDDEDEAFKPSMAFSNDVPLSLDAEEFYPFGRMPHPPATLYLASEEAFTKDGGEIDVEFLAPTDEESEITEALEAGECPWCDDYEGDYPETHARQAHPDEWEAFDSGDDEETDGEDGDAEDRLTPDRAGPLAGPPEISWEYWNGNGWTRLDIDSDETDAFREGGSVQFTVPEDLESTAVSGHEDFWIRARLVSGNYGEPQYEVSEDGTRGQLIQRPDPPVFEDIHLQFGHRDVAFENVITSNNVSYRHVHSPETPRLDTTEGVPIRPYHRLPGDEQTVYLGFDAPLRDGPINLHIPMHDKAYPREFDTGLRWEYCENPEDERWKKLDVYDGTEGLTERGIVSLTFPSTTTKFERFGEERHWIRARLTRDPFVVTLGSETTGNGETPVGPDDMELADQESRTPPTLEGIHPNTQWAYNERTVEERLGSSNGSPDQEFVARNVPITEATVWVDESGALSEPERRQLEAATPDRIRREDRPGDRDPAVWVQWEEVPDFLNSGEESRHYRLDRTRGIIRFGDGREGAIPPTGDENIEIVYQTGGGSDGNVGRGKITDLRTSISRIDDVRNLKPSDGGTDTESLERAIDRAPTRIKNRDRAVSAADFEEIAKEASRQLATVKCEPGMTDTGERKPGWVTLLVIPRERRQRPTPSLELRQRVKEAVSERAPATLAEHDRKRIVVRGPDYAEVSVQTTIYTRGVESVTNLKNVIEETLEDFFHPLNGGRDGSGWAFATAPRLSQLSTLVESLDGVDRVEDISMTIQTATEEKIIRDPERVPALKRDEMISSGTHDIRIRMEGQRP